MNDVAVAARAGAGPPFPWWTSPAVAAGAFALGALATSWRLQFGGTRPLDTPPELGRGCIFMFWHDRMLPLIWSHRGRGVVVLVSRSRDGELTARLIERLGFRTARGSTSRAALEGTRELLRAHRQGREMAITPDGPRGPAGVLQPGIVFLASRTGLPVYPVASASSSAWRLRSWDRYRVPHPFSRVAVVHGDPIRVPPELDAAGVAVWSARLQAALDATTARADQEVA